MAERQGFEPWVPSRARRISSAVHSTTLPPLRRRSAGPMAAAFLVERRPLANEIALAKRAFRVFSCVGVDPP